MSVPPVRVAVLGSGFSGIAAAVELRRRGIEFTIFEQAEGIGGTWWHTRYPGAEVDLESHIYSFSYQRWDWTRTHAGWQELQGYLQAVAATHGLLPRIRFGEAVREVVWVEESSQYEVRTSSGRDHGRFTAVISAVGFFTLPQLPPFARAPDFGGVVCHTSAWPAGLDLTGKAVGVVGTGSSAAQVVPAAERVAASVTVFQQSPNWLLPKGSRDFTPLERRCHRWAPVYRARRRWLYTQYDVRQMRAGHARVGGLVHRRRAAASRAYLQAQLGDRPELLELATPHHAFEGKRTVISDDYYRALRSPKVRLIPHGCKELTRTGAKDADGGEHELDVVVLATGFDAANYLGGIRVVGEGGQELHASWSGEARAYLGMMVPGFPNFFIMYGPNTNAIPLVSCSEAQARFAAGLIDRLRSVGGRRIDVRASVFRHVDALVQRRLARTVWARTSSYFRAGSGRIVSQWPFSPSAYILATKLTRRWATTIR